MTVQATVTSTLNAQSADLILIEDGDSRNYETKTLGGGSETFVFTSLDGGLDKEYTAKIVPSTTDVTATAEVNYGATVEIDPLPHRDVDADSTIRETAEFNNGVAANSLGLGDNPLINGLLTSALNDGEVLADDGYVYSSVQAAQDAASSWIFIGPGTFNENVDITESGLTVKGSGYNTLIDGGSSYAISYSVSDVTVANLSVKNDSNGGFCIKNASSTNALTYNVRFRQGTQTGGRMAPDSKTINCHFENMTDRGLVVGGSTNSNLRAIVSGCMFEGTTNGQILQFSNSRQDNIVANNVFLDAGDEAIDLDADDSIIIGNRIHNSTNDGIRIAGADNIIANNRVSGSGAADINDSGTGTVLDGNNTGAAN